MQRGLSIIEVMIFIAVLAIAVIGASGYRYFSMLDIRRSDNEITAGRIASQLLESWKGRGGGDSNYSPLPNPSPPLLGDPCIGFNIASSSSAKAPSHPANFTLLNNGGYYKIVSDNDKIFYATMSSRTIDSNNGHLETLNVVVSWPAIVSSPQDSVTHNKYVCLTDLLIVH
jgi:Tfp pilus assembly protein PilV